MKHSQTFPGLSSLITESFRPSVDADTRWHTSGIIDFQAPFNSFALRPDLPLITEGADEQVGRGRSQHIDRNAAAILLDWNLRRLSQGKAVIDLRLGELLVQLRKRQPQKLGFVRLPDYTREEMGIPWRSASQLVSNWTALEKLPHLRKAHRDGRISKSKLRFLLRVATADNEAAWIEKASKVSVRTLEESVRAVDAGPRACISQTGPDGKEETRTTWGQAQGPAPTDRTGYLMTLKTTSEKAAIWDFALEHFRGHEGGNFSTEVFIEALLAEFCSAIPLPVDSAVSDAAGTVTGKPRNGMAKGHSNLSTPLDSASVPIDAPLPKCRQWRRIAGDEDDEFLSGDSKEIDEEKERWRTLRRDLEDVTQIWEFLSWTPVTVETPLEWDEALEDIRAAANMIKKILAMRQLVGFYMGRLLRTFENLHLYADMQFASLNHYVVERLGISMRTARNLIKLVRSFLSLPVLEKAFKDGSLTQQRALLLLKVAREKTEKEWLRYGIEVPVLDLEREIKRLSRLIEANPNLLDAYQVLPEFVPPEKTKSDADSGKGLLKAEGGSSGALEKLSTTAVQMCATEKLPTAAYQDDDDDGPWEVVLRKETVDINDPSEIESWQMIMSGRFDCEGNKADEMLAEPADIEATVQAVQMCASEMLPDKTELEAPDPTGKMSASEAISDTVDPESEVSSVQMCASEDDSAGIKSKPSELTVGSSKAGSASESPGSPACSPDKNTAAIRFFIPDSLIPMWNYAFIRYLELAAGSEAVQGSPPSQDTAQNNISSPAGEDIQSASAPHPAGPDDSCSLLEGFLFSLIYHYLENEQKVLKRVKRRLRHKVIERDDFRCIIPGCSSRAGLDDHHIRFRSQGGGNELPNNSATCHLHHCQCIHDNRYITINGQAPDNLTIAMGVDPGRSPFALFINGRRINQADEHNRR